MEEDQTIDQSRTNATEATLFAAVALHKLLAGMDEPEEHFSQMADSYEEVCKQAWHVATRMVRVQKRLDEGDESSGPFDEVER